MNRKIKIFLILCIIWLPLFLNAATTDYKLLEPIAGGPTSISSGEGIEAYIQTIYNYLLGLAVALSVLMLVIGGVEYTTSFANAGAAENAKKRITDAITGLLIALLSFVILNTISPDLARLNLPNATESCGATSNSTSTDSGRTLTETPVVGGQGSASAGSEQEIRSELLNIGITTNNNPCINGQTTGCTNLDKLGTSAVKGLKELKQTDCPNCEIVITGGTEGGHKTHGPGKNQVDLRKTDSLNSYIISNAKSVSSTNKGKLYTLSNGDKYLDETGGTPHWHVVYTNYGR